MSSGLGTPPKKCDNYSMINDIIIIDDVISKNYQDAIEDRLLNDRNFPWYYIPNISKRTNGEDVMSADSFGFAHAFLDRNGPLGKMNDFFLPLAYEACSKINFTPKEFYYGRVFMTVAMSNSPNHNMFHVDMMNPHLVCLYYVNDSTGPTVISNKTHHDISQDEINNLEEIEITHCVEPKKGRAILFDGKYFHASTNPSTSRRCIINFNMG